MNTKFTAHMIPGNANYMLYKEFKVFDNSFYYLLPYADSLLSLYSVFYI